MPIKVYNFEVEDFHTYFVGESSVLVHNDCGTPDRKEGQYHVFDVYEMDASKYYSSDKVQFRAANKELKNKLENDDAFRKDMYKRHPELADWVDSGRMDSSPAGFTWHHSEETGKLLLVDASDHRSNYKIYHP